VNVPDDDLQQRLLAADVPPPPGTAMTPARLRQRAARQLRRQLLTAAAAVTLLGAPLLLRPAPTAAPRSAVGDDRAAELLGLQARLERWQSAHAARTASLWPSPSTIASPASPFDRHRWQHDLARARASALLPTDTTTRSETRR
jgi:hypothetical protein